MAILNFTLVLTFAFVIFVSMSTVEGLICLRCLGQECKGKTSFECKSKDSVCVKQTIEKSDEITILRTCIRKPPGLSLGCTTETPQPGITVSECFCDTDNCDPEPESGSAAINAELGKSAGLTLTRSIPAPFSIIICIIAAAIYKI